MSEAVAQAVAPGQADGVGASGVLGSGSAPTPAEARAEIARLQVDANFRKSLLAGDAAETARWKGLIAAAHPTAAPASPAEPGPNEVDVAIATRAGIDMSGEVGADITAILSGKPVAAEVKNTAERRHSLLMSDRQFRQKWLDGDLESRRILTTLNVLRTAKTAGAA